MTTRHEVAVAAVSARYITRGYSWVRDKKPSSLLEHQADGVATRDEIQELIEVELTAKSITRYRQIFDSHTMRLTRHGIARVAYFCTPDVARIVEREADRFVFRTDRARITVHPVFDRHGRWLAIDDTAADAIPPASVPMQLTGFGDDRDTP
ncbi:hypothetical protein [Marisediminicola senii]|uniref:hypothetical protein n=1 Tax=Marisediminicola senii TaxID=2711233 RepID=UPI0013ECDD7D|nr:hypothetical protein [Marisediminicola senii]